MKTYSIIQTSKSNFTFLTLPAERFSIFSNQTEAQLHRMKKKTFQAWVFVEFSPHRLPRHREMRHSMLVHKSNHKGDGKASNAFNYSSLSIGVFRDLPHIEFQRMISNCLEVAQNSVTKRAARSITGYMMCRKWYCFCKS